MKMSRILTIIAVVLVLMLSFTSCDIIQGLIPGGHQHSFNEGKCECGATDPDYKPDHKHNFVEGKCECGAEDPDYKPGHEHSYVDGKCECGAEDPNYVATTTPAISVVPAELEINAGDEIDLMFGVTVTDEGDENPRLVIEDDSDFDADTEGVYVITYKAINKFGNEATATRTIKVNKALSAITLEVQKNLLGETKWQGTMISFKNQLFVELNGDMTIDTAESGVFHNSTNAPVVLNVSGGYGVAAVINANGVVVEGRDGANGRLVDALNPVRASSTAKEITVNGEKVSVVENFAKNLVIPAGGYAIVVQNGYCGTTVDSDGRGFLNYNVIGTYGNVVRLLWADTAEVLTPYVDQAPVISGNGTIVYAAIGDTTFDFNGQAILGVTATDDNGTFDPTDDTTVEIKIDNNGGYDIAVAGKYNVVLSATDGTNTATAVRVVEVTTNVSEIKVGDKSYKTLPENFAFDLNVDKLGSYHFIIYTPAFRPAELAFTNGWGEAFVLNQYGQIIRIYDGANGKYYDADNKAGIVDATKCTAADFWKQAYASLQEGEYLVIAPNGAPGNASRGFLLGNRTIGAVMTLPGITFAEAPHECESKCEICGKCLNAECDKAVCAEKCPNDHAHVCKNACETCGKCQNADCTETVCAEKCACHECESKCEHCGGCTDAECTQAACATKCQGHEGHMFVTIGSSKKYEAIEGMWAINETITTATAANKAVWVFTKDYTGEFTTNGYGVAVVLDKYGRITEVYDGANGGYWLPSGKQASAHFTTATYATVAWAELEEGEYLVVFPNGADGNKARQIGLDSRYLFNQKMNITGIEFKSMTMTIEIGSKNYTAELGKWAINETITTATAANKAIWIFTKDYTGEFSTNGFGAAVILDKFGRVNRIYDGANAGYTDAASGVNNKNYGVTTDNYATLAWESLQEGEYLVLLPNGGSTDNAARKVGLDCRWLIGQKMSVTGIEFEIPHDCESKCATCGNCLDAACAESACATKCGCFTMSIGDKIYTAVAGKWAINETITTSTAVNKAIWIFTKDYTGEFSTNGFGAAVILDKFGKIVRIYDGANAGYTDAAAGVNNKNYGVTTDNYAALAWESLQDGEYLVVLPNGGSDGNAARKVGLDCRWLIGQKLNLTGIEYASETMTVQIGSKVYTAELGKWAVNETITTATAANKAIWVFTKDYTGEFSTNGWGVAVVLTAEGKVSRVYDGANAGYTDATSGVNNKDHGVTTANFATLAFESLQEGEILVVLPNGGSDGNAARQIGLDCRFLIGQQMSVTGFEFK